MTSTKTIVVFGLGAPSWGSPTPLGRGVGGYCCLHAARKGWKVRAVARNPAKYAPCFENVENHSLIEIVKGDGCNRDSVRELIKGCEACVFAIQAADGQSSYDVDCNALAMMAEECQKENVKLIAISSAWTSPKRRWNLARMFANTFLKWNMMDAKWAGEERVRKIGNVLRYTIIRPGGLSDAVSPGRAITVGQFDNMSVWSAGLYITKDDVAAVCIEATANPASDQVSIDLAGPTKANTGKFDVTGMFEKMQKDPFVL